MYRTIILVVPLAVASAVACSSSSSSPPSSDPDAGIDLGGDPYVDAAIPDADKNPVDGGFAVADAGVVRADRFVTHVVSFTPGDCAGFGLTKMPDVVYGPPIGAGDSQGGLDVVSFGHLGSIVVGFGDNGIADEPGVDFIVFENAFYAAGDPSHIAADLGEVSVSEDGTTWKTFPCSPGASPPYGACAGWHPVYSAPDNGISPFDVEHAGGDAYDLADVGLAHAKLVRIVDKGTIACPANPPKPSNIGFDLDAVAITHPDLL